MINIDEFQKVEMRVGKVLSVEKVSDADKLLKFVLDMGTEERQVLSGIAEYYTDLESLVGKDLIIVVNLEPRTIRGLESRGMVLTADNSGSPVLLHPAVSVPPGSIIK